MPIETTSNQNSKSLPPMYWCRGKNKGRILLVIQGWRFGFFKE